jgi:RNA polymerase sigma factor (sigma-70 family)
MRSTMALPEFSDLLRTHAGLIQKVARAYCRDATDREDVTQEICAQLWRSRDRFDDRQRLATWVYRVAFNVAISFHRRERRHRGGRVPVDGLLAPEPGRDDDRTELLWRCLDELGALDKALVLLWLDGNDHASTAAVLGMTTTNVGTRLGRAKDRLRAAYSALTPNDMANDDAR